MQSNSLGWYTKNTIKRVCQALNQDNVIISTTDTVLGLLANVSRKGRVVLDNVKRRSEKPYLILVDSKIKAQSFIDAQSVLHIEKLIDYCWPGPVTLIVKAHQDVPTHMKSQQNTIALRVPDHSQLRELLSCTGPLFSTSANKAGEPVPDTIEGVNPEIVAACALIITDESTEKSTVSSTILDCTTESIRVIREGAYPVKELERIYGKRFIT